MAQSCDSALRAAVQSQEARDHQIPYRSFQFSDIGARPKRARTPQLPACVLRPDLSDKRDDLAACVNLKMHSTLFEVKFY
jgi:hypothetical protein